MVGRKDVDLAKDAGDSRHSLLYTGVTVTLRNGARTLLGAKGIATRNKDATRGSWPYYQEQGRYYH